MKEQKYKNGQIVLLNENVPTISKSYISKHGLIHRVKAYIRNSERYQLKSIKTGLEGFCSEKYILGLALESESEEF